MAASVVDGNGGSGGQVVTELLGHIKELVTQLEVHLGGSSPDLCKHLTSQISAVTERSISLLITTPSSSSHGGARKRSAVTSQLSDGSSGAPFVKATKKRKTIGKKRIEVRVRVSSAGNHPADDGHSWRKYGQKEILGAKHPRGYYRCTHRHSQGCAATKQVQRTDEDPTFFDVVYLGEHTCVPRAAAAAAAAVAAEAAADEQAALEYEYNDSPGTGSVLQSLTVKSEGSAVELEQLLSGWDAPTLFCFSSTPATASASLVPERSPFSVPSTSENWGVSPATSGSNHVVSFPPFDEVAGGDVQFGFGEVMSAIDRADGDDLDIDVSCFLA